MIILALILITYFILNILITPNYYDPDIFPQQNGFNGNNQNLILNWYNSSEFISLNSFLKFYGITSFSMEFIILLFPLRSSMKRQKDFTFYIFQSVIVYIILSILVTYSINIVIFF